MSQFHGGMFQGSHLFLLRQVLVHGSILLSDAGEILIGEF